MTNSTFYFCAIPAKYWQAEAAEDYNLSTFVKDALSTERRIRKEVDQVNERNRYTLICKRLESKVILSGKIAILSDVKKFSEKIKDGYFPSWVCPHGYLSLLIRYYQSSISGRFGASFYPPDQIEEELNQFQKWTKREGFSETASAQSRLDFFLLALKNKCGVVELQTSFLAKEKQEKPIKIYKDDKEEKQRYISIPKFALRELDTETFGDKGKKQHLFKILLSQIQYAIKHNEPVSFGNQAPHDVITEALHHFVFVPSSELVQPVNLRVMYADGSEAEPFPLFCIKNNVNINKKNDNKTLKIALMSMRHFELDPDIDFCWLRNRDVSRTRTLAETDHFCFSATTAQLSESLKLGKLQMYLYHTGFEPAVIGFYRSVVKRLIQLEGSNKREMLCVMPQYFRGGNNYQLGKFWF